MGEFLQKVKVGQIKWLANTATVTPEAKRPGLHSIGKMLPYCIPAEHAAQNLMPAIREKAVEYFRAHGIKWHDHSIAGPSNHLADSQVCCVNFLMALAGSEDLLINLFRRYFPNIIEVLPMDEGELVAFEWIGAKNYLKEKIRPGEKRVRGSMCTSADAAVMFKTHSGRKIIVLIEWKYSESYKEESYRFARSGTDRMTIYQHLYDKDNFPVDKSKLPAFESLFYEPFYQFMRQQCLAREMETAHELGADEVYVMHLSPKANKDFGAVTSAELRQLGSTATEVWQALLVDKSRFLPLHIDEFFDNKLMCGYPDLRDHWNYLRDRYASVLE